MTIRSLAFILTIAIATMSQFGCDLYKGDRLSSRKKEYVGTYKISLTRSKLKSYARDSDLYRNLTLVLAKNDSFFYNKKVPFIYSQQGKWKVDGEPLGTFAYLLFSPDFGDQILLNVDHSIFINFPIPTKPARSVEILWFDKISDSILLR